MTKKCLGILDVGLYLEHAELEIFLSVGIHITEAGISLKLGK